MEDWVPTWSRSLKPLRDPSTGRVLPAPLQDDPQWYGASEEEADDLDAFGVEAMVLRHLPEEARQLATDDEASPDPSPAGRPNPAPVPSSRQAPKTKRGPTRGGSRPCAAVSPGPASARPATADVWRDV